MTGTAFRPRRSLIFAPGNKSNMFLKAMTTGADMVCIDLEDAVAPEHKEEAREKAVASFQRMGTGEGDGPERLVRINSLHSNDGLSDLIALVESSVTPLGLILTKVKSPGEVVLADDILTEAGVSTGLHVMIETNQALKTAYEIGQASPRIRSLVFGAIDMAADLRTTPTWSNMLYARSRVVHASAAAQVDFIDVPWLDLEDMDGLREEATLGASLGVTGKAAIHPKQIAILNEIFSPSTEDIEQARQVIAAFDKADGGLVVIDGKLIEKPVLRTMQRILAIADQTSAGS